MSAIQNITYVHNLKLFLMMNDFEIQKMFGLLKIDSPFLFEIFIEREYKIKVIILRTNGSLSQIQ